MRPPPLARPPVRLRALPRAHEARMRVRVDRVYLGKAEQTITVLPGQGNANRVGGPWTFYLRHDVIAYTHTDCGGSHPSSLTPEELAFFGSGSTPTPDQQLFGPTGNT